MTIRQALPSDAAAAAPLLLAAMQGIAYQLTGASEESEVLGQLTKLFHIEDNRLSYQNVLVKEKEGNLAGVLLAYHGSEAVRLDQPILERLRSLNRGSEIRISQEADKDEYYIDSLAVSPNARGKGIGQELIQAAEKKAAASGYARIALIVVQENPRARALYERLGYVKNKEKIINNKTYDHMVKQL